MINKGKKEKKTAPPAPLLPSCGRQEVRRGKEQW